MLLPIVRIIDNFSIVHNKPVPDLVTDILHAPRAKTINKVGAWIGAQLKISCSKIRKLRSGDYKEIGVRFLCSV